MTWFVSYAHEHGFGRVVLTMSQPYTDEDLAHIEHVIQQKFGYRVPPVVLYYRRVGNP